MKIPGNPDEAEKIKTLTRWSSWLELRVWRWGWGCSGRRRSVGGAGGFHSEEWPDVLQWCCCCLFCRRRWSSGSLRYWEDTGTESGTIRSAWRWHSCSPSHISHGTPPTVMVRSDGSPVRRFRPVMVKDIPPALGPLSGVTPITDGSCNEKNELIKY